MIISTPYYHTARKLLEIGLADNSTNFYMLLHDGTRLPTLTDTALDATGEVFGNGWPENGVNLTNLTITTTNTDEAFIDCDDISVIASGGVIAATHAIVYLDEGGLGTTLTPLWSIDFGGQIGAPDGETLVIAIHANGLLSGAFTA